MTAAPARGDLQTVKAMEVAQLANEGAFIGGTAAVTFAIVLVVSLSTFPSPCSILAAIYIAVSLMYFD